MRCWTVSHVIEMSGANWVENENWLSTKPLREWQGVDTEGGRVTRFDLDRKDPAGEILGKLGNLESLELLNFGDNLSTGEIPPELGNLANLEGLSFYKNMLTGEIPSELGNLANLEDLDLPSGLSGCMPVGLKYLDTSGQGELEVLPLCE